MFFRTSKKHSTISLKEVPAEQFVAMMSLSRMAGKDCHSEVLGTLASCKFPLKSYLEFIYISDKITKNYSILCFFSTGTGRYHGKYSYDTFVHKKSVLTRSFSKINEKINAVRYPPYSKGNMKVIANFMKYLHIFEMRARPAVILTTIMAGVFASVAYTAGWFSAAYKKRNP